MKNSKSTQDLRAENTKQNTKKKRCRSFAEMVSLFPVDEHSNSNFDVESLESNRLLPSIATSSSSYDETQEEEEEEKDVLKDAHALDQGKYSAIEIEHLEEGEGRETPPFSWKKLWVFTGPGILMSIAFLDPGNIEGDLQAGAISGYSLLWLLLWATIVGLLIQLLSARVGVATGKPLAEICREEYEPWARYLLWAMAEVAVIAADIQEVIGTAIAIQILSHGVLPLWFSVVITAADCFVFLFLEGYGLRKMEAAFAFMVATMAISFAYMFADAEPNGKELLIGVIVPKLSSKTIQQAVGIFGCIVTPHNVYLHSALVQSRNVNTKSKSEVQEAINYFSIESSMALLISFMINLFVTTVFAKGFYGTEKASKVGLANAGHYLEEKYGGGLLPILYMWGIGLLAAGQSSTITGTYAGQFIMGGFLNLQVKEWLRAVLTRSFAIVPTLFLAVMFDTSESTMDIMNEWLNVLQSLQIPFALIPLFTIVCREELMGVFKLGPALEIVTWIVMGLVMVINGYVMLDIFMNVISGFLSRFLFSILITGYMAFIVYLSSCDGALPSTWLNTVLFQRFSYIGRERSSIKLSHIKESQDIPLV